MDGPSDELDHERGAGDSNVAEPAPTGGSARAAAFEFDPEWAGLLESAVAGDSGIDWAWELDLRRRLVRKPNTQGTRRTTA